MPSFFEKLKKGMNADISSLNLKINDDAKTTKPTEKKEKANSPADKPPSIKENPKKKEAPRLKKKVKIEKVNPPAGELLVSEKKQMTEVNLEEKKEPLKTRIEVKKEEKKGKTETLIEKQEPSLLKKERDDRSWFEPEGQLAVDVYETDGEIVVQAAIAGIKAEEFDINIENDVITIKGERKKTFEKEDKNYFYQECYWGRFSREIILPAEVDGSRAQASMKDGVLTIRIPKIEREKKRKIVIK